MMENIDLVRKLYESLRTAEAKIESLEKKENGPVAIVGMSCRFPGADSIASFWNNLCNEQDAVIEVPADRWNKNWFYDKNPDTPGKSYCNSGTFLADVKGFDAAFFKITPAEAKHMSPQQRILLETTWQALESANIRPGSLMGTGTAVYLSASDDHYKYFSTENYGKGISPYSVTGTAAATASGRIAYQLGLTGANMVVDTACSSSLVAVDLGMQELRAGKTDLVIAGGINLQLSPLGHICLSKTRALSPDGRCKTFDESADGYGRGEGCGIVILKRYEDAVRDGDHIFSIIRGSALNQDGASNGMTAPNGLAQERLLHTALEQAGVSASEVLYLEAHGTGTKLGDPIEVEAIQHVYNKIPRQDHPLYIGSVKTNIGHLEAASGVASLIKTALCLYHGKIPASLHYNSPNPAISWNDQVKVVTTLTDLPAGASGFAAVSAFGFSGTNVHMVLQSAHKANQGKQTDEATLLMLSAKSVRSLKKLVETYVLYLKDTTYAITDIAFTALHCRDHFEEKLAVIATDKQAAIQLLQSFNTTERLLVAPGVDTTTLLKEAHTYLHSKIITPGAFSIQGTKVPIPVYQFDHEMYWIDAALYRAFINPEQEETTMALAAEVKNASAESLSLYVNRIIREITELSTDAFTDEDDFFSIGLDSIMLMHMREMILDDKHINIEIAVFYDRVNTPGKLKEFLQVSLPADAYVEERADDNAYVPYKQPEVSTDQKLNEQDEALVALVNEVVEKSGGSREITQHFRRYFANNRNIAGFKPKWKDMVYQLVAEKGAGAHIWDVNGNRFLDFTMGFGVHLFGYNPPFVNEALQDILQRQLILGALSPQAGRLAERICTITGNDRVAFYNTGTEAVMVALRLARAATGKNKIVLFSGSYHGTFDGILARPGKGIYAEPLAPGVSNTVSQDVIVLRYGNEQDLEHIITLAGEIAAVLVEPVQSRRPDFFPAAYLEKLSRITSANNIALIFDEVISGFRFAINGIRAFTKVRPDLTTYGKIIGGGIPVGIVAGNKRFMDAVDGGHWSYGDPSYPAVTNTFVAGTFCHHPLAMEAGMQVLDYLEANPDIYISLEEKTAQICSELNRYFEEKDLPVSMVHFGSLFRFVLKGNYELLFYKLLAKNIYIWEGRNCYVATAHTQEDIRYFIDAVKQSFEELLAAQLIRTEVPVVNTRLSYAQQNIWWAWKLQPDSSAFNLSETLLIEGPFLPAKFEEACNLLLQKHEILRMSFYEEDGIPRQQLRTDARIMLSEIFLPEDESAAEKVLFELNSQPFNTANELLWRVSVCRRGEDRYIVSVTIHHIICDGWSMEILFNELIDTYNELTTGNKKDPSQPIQYRQYIEEEQNTATNEQLKSFWHRQVSNITPMNMPAVTGSQGKGEETLLISGVMYSQIKQLAADLNLSVFIVVAAVTQLLLHCYTGATDLTTGTPVTGRSKNKWNRLIGHFLNILVLRIDIRSEESAVNFLNRLKTLLLEMYEKQDYPFELLKNECWDRSSTFPFFEVEISLQNFRLKRHHNDRKFNDLTVRPLGGSLSIDPRKYPMEFRFDEGHEDIMLKLVYDSTLYPDLLIQEMISDWQQLLELLIDQQDQAIGALIASIREMQQQRKSNALQTHRKKNITGLLSNKIP
ncbi:aminotransferase class III-fold pyridoxal phosphate-dependent enzyme [Chitinophaga sp. LS1]|uniref:aminotransferase class III-fold pyridoxal phosphate-dependent enzyme n=1 Tax=Chitinophaga sp. LS1 TaxID=3051176 RepID=UPI002AABC1BB|nr:aminotransferase class III-fold pyridoxal phosphate-dependent enzyme [Chitinophaga sp. LS1]WPV63813.1 aminotransferase class III-fold pyridoxal phosphate-dependent enzyme [Chitinophaga sp. LS1]